MRLDHLLSRETAELETAKLKDLRSIDELRKQGVRKRSVKDAKERQSTFENPERKRRMQRETAVPQTRKTLYRLQGSALRDLWGFSSAGRAPALQAGGERFDPANLHTTWVASSAG